MKRKHLFLHELRCLWESQCAGGRWACRSEAQSEKRALRIGPRIDHYNTQDRPMSVSL